MGSSDGPLVPISPSDAFVGTAWRTEGRFDSPGADTLAWELGRDVRVEPETEGRDDLGAAGVEDGPTEARVVGAGRGRLDATVDVREAPPIEGRVGAPEDSCFVGDLVGD